MEFWRRKFLEKCSVLIFVIFVLLIERTNSSSRISNTIDITGDKLVPADRTFAIDYEGNTFTMDGQPFRYVAGSLHYFRVPHQYWRDRLRTLRSGGLNAVTTYVDWSFHETEKGQYEWTGDKALESFIQIAQDEDLYVILRPGPYICAEREFGGYPYWLLTYYPNIKLRTSDEDYKREVTTWYGELMPRMKPLLYGYGGPIIMMQIENEYGYYPDCDHDYMAWLADLTQSWVQDAAVLFTTDGPGEGSLTCGTTPGVYATVDFGTGQVVSDAWAALRKFSTQGPLVNSEFYSGWFTHWGEPNGRVSTESIINSLTTILDDNANVNFYMFYGGTNFGYFVGGSDGVYVPVITSYDYDAPMTEAGDPTSKYHAIANLLSNYLPEPPYPPPEVKPKGSIDSVTVRPVLPLLGADGRSRLGRATTRWYAPPTMEAIGQRAGLILYETELPASRTDPSALTIEGVRDRALVYLDGVYVGVLSRTRGLYTLPILADQGNFLQILVQNQGRMNSGANDFKGILNNVTLNLDILADWNVTSFPLETIEEELQGLIGRNVPDTLQRNSFEGPSGAITPTADLLAGGPVVYSGEFVLNEGDVLDMYMDVTGWGKGLAWINNRLLGHYWPSEGPQITLYTPGVYLNAYPAGNTVVLLEMEKAPSVPEIKFIDHHIGM